MKAFSFVRSFAIVMVAVVAAMAAKTYVIEPDSETGATFKATESGTDICITNCEETEKIYYDAIQNVIEAIRDDANVDECVIQFNDVNLHENNIIFEGEDRCDVTLKGKLENNTTTNPSGGGDSYLIKITGNNKVKIEGGEFENSDTTQDSYAIIVENDAEITLSGSPIITGKIAVNSDALSVDSNFDPDEENIYVISFNSVGNSTVVVKGGKDYIDNFEVAEKLMIHNGNLVLDAKGYYIHSSSGGKYVIENDYGYAFSMQKILQEINNKEDASSSCTIVFGYTEDGLAVEVGGEDFISFNRGLNCSDLTLEGKIVATSAYNYDLIKINIDATGIITSKAYIEYIFNDETSPSPMFDKSIFNVNNGKLIIANDTIKISENDGYAVKLDDTNTGDDPYLVLTGAPVITGKIGVLDGQLSVSSLSSSSGSYYIEVSVPGSDVIAVAGGANFIDKFTLVNKDYVLVKDGNNIGMMRKYVVVYEAGEYKASNVSMSSSSNIQQMINYIRENANGDDCIIQFGDGVEDLSISSSITFENDGSYIWGNITLQGGVSSGYTVDMTMIWKDDIKITNEAEIKNENNSGVALKISSTVSQTIAGGKIIAINDAIWIDDDSDVTLKGSPDILGKINMKQEKIIVLDEEFAPNGKVYKLYLRDLMEGDDILIFSEKKDLFDNFILMGEGDAILIVNGDDIYASFRKYYVTQEGNVFTIKDEGTEQQYNSIQEVIDHIKNTCNACTIKFDNLNIGIASITFNGSEWNNVTLTGEIKGYGEYGVLNFVSVSATIDGAKITGISTNAIINVGMLTIINGEIKATNGHAAIYNRCDSCYAKSGYGYLILSGAPEVEGTIRVKSGNLSVSKFEPAGKSYELYIDGEYTGKPIAVARGKEFFNNFTLSPEDDWRTLAIGGDDIILINKMPTYIITKSETYFKTSYMEWNGDIGDYGDYEEYTKLEEQIQDLLNFINNREYSPYEIQFGESNETLDIGTQSIDFSNDFARQSKIVLVGKLTGESETLINIGNFVSINSMANIKSTAENGNAFVNNGTLSISYGEIKGDIDNGNYGLLNITGGTVDGNITGTGNVVLGGDPTINGSIKLNDDVPLVLKNFAPSSDKVYELDAEPDSKIINGAYFSDYFVVDNVFALELDKNNKSDLVTTVLGYKVTFDYDNDDDEYITYVLPGAKVKEISTEGKTKENYVLHSKKWFNDEVIFDFEEEINSDLTLVLKWLDVSEIEEKDLAEGIFHDDYEANIIIDGYGSVITFVEGGLPDGLELYNESGVISGTPSKAGEFTFLVRYEKEEIEEIEASEETEELEVTEELGDNNGYFEYVYFKITIDKATGAEITKTINVTDKTSNSITIEPITIDDNTQDVEYAINDTGEAPEEEDWLLSSVFEGLNPYTYYHIFARAQENENYYAGIHVTDKVLTLNTSVAVNLYYYGYNNFAEEIFVVKDGKLAKPPHEDITRPGYTTDGTWNVCESETETAFDFEEDEITEAISLCLVWKPVSIVIADTLFGIYNSSYSGEIKVSFGEEEIVEDEIEYNCKFFGLPNWLTSDGCEIFTVESRAISTMGSFPFIINVSVEYEVEDIIVEDIIERKVVNFVVSKANGAAVDAPDAKAESNVITIITQSSSSGGSSSSQTVEYAVNESSAIPQTGWQTELVFTDLEWNTSYYIFARAQENDFYKAGAAVMAASPIDIEKLYHTITFDLNGGMGEDLDTYTVEEGKAFLYSNDPISMEGITRPGYRNAERWCFDKQCLQGTFDLEEDLVYNDMTLYLEWNPASVTFVTEEIDETCTYGEEDCDISIEAKDLVDDNTDNTYGAEITYFVIGGKLPEDLTLSENTGKITGTPSEVGTFTFTVEAKSNSGEFAIGQFTLVVNKAESNAPVGIIAEVTRTSITLTYNEILEYAMQSPTTAILYWQDSSKFENLQPSTTYTLFARVKETEHYLPSDSVKIVATTLSDPTFTIATPSLDTAEYKKTYESTIQISGNSEGIIFSIFKGSLPDSLKLSIEGTISGTPAAAGTFTFTVVATHTESGAAAYEQFTLVVKPATLDSGSYDKPTNLTATYNQTLSEVTLSSGWEWENSQMFVGDVGERKHVAIYSDPAGTSYNPVRDSLTVIVKQANGWDIVDDSATVVSTSRTSITINPLFVRNEQEVEYAAVASGDSIFDWQTSNVFQNLSPGTTYSIYARTAKSDNYLVGDPALVATATTQAIDDIYIVSFNLSGGTGLKPVDIPVESGKSVDLPSISGIVKAGYINRGGWYTITNKDTIKDTIEYKNAPITANTTLYLKWSAATVAFPETQILHNGTLNYPYSQAVSATVEKNAGGKVVYELAGGNLPNGLSLNANTGAITGKPSKTGTFKFEIKAKSLSSDAHKTKEFTITIVAAAAKELAAQAQKNALYVSGLSAGKTWEVYSASGALVYRGVANGNDANINFAKAKGVYFVKSNGQITQFNNR